MPGNSIPAIGVAPDSGRPPRSVRALSPQQLAAIHAVMRIFVEDDRERGVTADEMVDCAGCRRPRAAAGAINYGDITLCHHCALSYEVMRASGRVRNAEAFVAERSRRPAP